jgi:hypothetical protein
VIFSERIPPEYQDILDLRGNNPIGGVPPTEEMFDFFSLVSGYVGPVSNILEFGFLYGMSAAIQLTVHPISILDAYDVNVWELDVGPKSFSARINSPELAKLVWGDRFNFYHESSMEARSRPKGYYQYVFIDGLHTFQGAYSDIETARQLCIPYAYIDNLEYTGVNEAIKRSRVRLISEHEYDQYNPITMKSNKDRIGLFAL